MLSKNEIYGSLNLLVGLVVQASTSRAADPGFESYQGLKNWNSSGYPARRLAYRVSAGAIWPGVSLLWLSKIECLICNFYFSVAACAIIQADPSLRYTSMLLGRQATKKTNNMATQWALFRLTTV